MSLNFFFPLPLPLAPPHMYLGRIFEKKYEVSIVDVTCKSQNMERTHNERLPKASRRDDRPGTGMWRGETKNTY